MDALVPLQHLCYDVDVGHSVVRVFHVVYSPNGLCHLHIPYCSIADWLNYVMQHRYNAPLKQ